MPAMIGRTLRSAVTCGLLLSLGACEETTPYPLTRVLAEQGNAEAQFSLGVAYDTGQGVAPTWLKRRSQSTSGHDALSLLSCFWVVIGRKSPMVSRIPQSAMTTVAGSGNCLSTGETPNDVDFRSLQNHLRQRESV